MKPDFDAIVAGGGVAGAAAAAVLAGLGWSVLVVEPGQHDERRLAGELVHPVGVAGLAELGLLSPAFEPAARLDGFVVFPDRDVARCIELPYRHSGAEPAVALAMDHGAICRTLLAGVAARPAVTVAHGWRVTGLAGAASAPIVQIRLGGRTETVSSRIVVAADGASSSVRAHAGLSHRRVRTAVMTGYLVNPDALPRPGRGHIFTAVGGPVLAYAMGDHQARVLLNWRLPHQRSAEGEATALDGLPSRLRSEVEAAMATGTGLRFVSSDVTVAGVARGRVVLVGDAAGSCHPISASGMTMGIDDAMRLGRALRGDDLAAAFAHYAAERRALQRARTLLAAMLHEALGGATAEAGMLRAAVHRYWSGSARARAASMMLLGMEDLRTRAVLLEFARVMAGGVFGMQGGALSKLHRAGLMARLSMPLMRHVLDALRVH